MDTPIATTPKPLSSEERVALAQRLFNEYYIQCFWHMKPDVVRFTAAQERKAMPLLFRHSPGMILPDRTYILGEAAVQLLRQHRVSFTEISREADAVNPGGVLSGERI
jgi:hypothetical protein